MTETEKRYELDIQVRIRDKRAGGSLEVSERLDISANGFLEIAEILSKFHQLGEAIQKEGR